MFPHSAILRKETNKKQLSKNKNKMKKMKSLLWGLTTLLALGGFVACDDDNDDGYWSLYPNALVTVKPVDSESFYMQLNDDITLEPANMKGSPFGAKEVRALTNYTRLQEKSENYDQLVYVNWIDSILTKPAITVAEAEAEGLTRQDPVEIVRDWVTIAEDGYLTLRFRAKWEGDNRTPHLVNLVTGVNPENPYEVQFRHDTNGDGQRIWGDGLVAFRLDGLPDTEGKTVKLKLTWKSFSGPKSAEFEYRTRETTTEGGGTAEVRPALILQ